MIALEGGAAAREVLLPSYLVARLGSLVGHRVTLHTLEYLEGQGQGTSFVPRVLGFGSIQEREFFELLTSVKGLGNKRALRAMAEEPARIASAIQSQDVKWLQRLPEIGRRLAETIVVDLREKVAAFAAAPEEAGRAGITMEAKGVLGPTCRLTPGAADAIATIVALGATEAEAQRMVERVLERSPELSTTEEIVTAAYGART